MTASLPATSGATNRSALHEALFVAMQTNSAALYYISVIGRGPVAVAPATGNSAA